jgi:hypothetical protein
LRSMLPDIASNFDVSRHLATGFGVPASTADHPAGAFRMVCDFSHLAYDDPIIYPGQPGRAHLHMFFGNTSANANSTYESLRQNGDGTCQGGPINRSAYWSPAVFNAAGQVVVPDFISVYYKGTLGTTSEIQNLVPLPNGMKMIAGFNPANGISNRSTTHFDWFCETNQVKQQTIPRCAPGERVGVVLDFPQCWDGINLDSADHRSHLAYINAGPQRSCPSTHPVRIPEFTLGFWFTHDGNSHNWYLSSDRMPGMPTYANGSSYHSDWLGAWDPTIRDRFMRHCINGMRNCSGGQLGDGTHMTERTRYTGPMLLPRP